MTDITEGNWSFRDPGDAISDGSIITGGNFAQHTPDTPIMVGKALTIRGGNFCNVRIDPSWTIEGGLFMQASRCSHLHPEWVSKGLVECVEVCSHVVDTHEVRIDGVLIDTEYERKDTIL